MKRHFAHLVLLTVALLLVVFPCAAQETFSNQEARARFEEGVKLANANDYERARVKFLQAYALEQRPTILINLAVCEQQTNRPLEAIAHAEEFLQTSQPNPKRAEDAKQLLVELDKVTSRIRIVAPGGLAITIDGATRGKTPARTEIHVLPGTHKVGVGETAQDVACPAGEVRTVEIKADTAVPPPDRTPAGGRIPVVAALGVVGAAGLALGIGFGAASAGKRDDAARLATPGACPTPSAPACAPLVGARSDAGAFGAASVVSWVAGGVFLAGAITAFLVWPKRQVELSLGPSSVHLSGTF